MKIFSVVLYAVFAIAAGLFLGVGNYHGLTGAILPGLIGGLLLSLPSFRDRSHKMAAVIVVGALVGSLAATFVPDGNNIKQLLRTQSNLHIKVGSYELGRGVEP
ncbi:MAG TPA: hypothetical protein V6C81_21750 [Planktothrix sp.]|jgi:hypothetical protein